MTSDTGPGDYIFSEDSESSTTSQQFPLTLIVMPRPRTRIDAAHLPNLGYNDRSRPVEQSDFARSIPIPNVYIPYS